MAQQVGGAVDVDRLGELGLFLAGGVADDRRQVNDRVHAVQGGASGRGVADVALGQLEKAIGAARQQAVAAELEVSRTRTRCPWSRSMGTKVEPT